MAERMDKDAHGCHVIIMDSLAKFLSGNPDATYEKCKEDCFADALAYGAAVRKIKPIHLEL